LTSYNTGSIAQRIRDRIHGIPTTVDSGTNLSDWADEARIRFNNAAGTSLVSSSFDESYLPVLTDWACLQVLSKLHGINVDFNASLGEFSISKSDSQSPESKQIDFYAKSVESELKNFRKIPFKQTFY
jgi:hypothetical protein